MSVSEKLVPTESVAGQSLEPSAQSDCEWFDHIVHNEPLNDDELLRYSRQILLDDWGLEAQERIKRSSVIIVGAGGLGCPVSETLARAGVGHIHLIDHDTIEASNLQRQTLFLNEDIGDYKSKKASEVLTRINPHISISYDTSYLDASAIMSLQAKIEDNTTPHLLLLDCTDNFAIRILLNKISVQTHTPLLSAAAIAMNGQLALYEPALGTGCYQCVFADVVSATTGGQNCTTSGVLASTTTVMGNLQANVALQYLGIGHNPLAGQLLNWDGKRMTQYTLNYKQDPNCPVCAIANQTNK